MTYIPKQEPRDLLDLAADYLARNGYAVVSAQIAELAHSIEARVAIGVAVPLHEFEAVLFGIFAGPYHQHRVFARKTCRTWRQDQGHLVLFVQ